MSYYARGHSIVDENDTEFDEYDPTPFNGGYNISVTYGLPLPPSEEICYPPSTSSSSYGAPDHEEEQVDYNRPSYSSDAEPLAYREEASVNEYKNYHRQPQRHPYPSPPAPYGEPGYGHPGYGFVPPPGPPPPFGGPPPPYGGPPPPYPPGGYDGGEPAYGRPGYGGPGYDGPPGPYRGSSYGSEPGSEYRSDRDQPGYGEERRYGRKQRVSVSISHSALSRFFFVILLHFYSHECDAAVSHGLRRIVTDPVFFSHYI